MSSLGQKQPELLEQSFGINNLIQMKNAAQLSSPEQPNLADWESLRRIFFAILETHLHTSLQGSEPGDRLKPPHYDLSRKIEILFYKKVIHDVLYKNAQIEMEQKDD
jgi:hypothetical protein